MKYTLLIILFQYCHHLSAQVAVVKFYHEDWQAGDSARHAYKVVFMPDGNTYKTTVYWKGLDKIGGTGTYKDTTLSSPIGLFVGYHKNGKTEDSSFYDNDSKIQYHYKYYKNGKTEFKYEIIDGKAKIEAFDESGAPIKNYIYEQEAEFKGGDKAWNAYLVKNLNKNLPAKDINNKTVKLKILFCIGADGYTTKIKILESSGLKYIDADAIRVITESPKWNNAIQYNKPVKVYRIQPLTYELSDPK